MNVGDIYQVRDTYNLTSGQTATLTRYYECETANPTDTAVHLNDRHNINITGALLALMDESYQFASRQTINGMDNLDFYEVASPEAGSLTGSQLPTALCAGIRSFDRGPGFTRTDHLLPIGNVTSINSSLGVWSGGFIVSCGTILDNFGDSLTLANGSEMFPVQLAAPFKLGVTPVSKQSLVGTWQINQYPSWLRTRQDYSWA